MLRNTLILAILLLTFGMGYGYRYVSNVADDCEFALGTIAHVNAQVIARAHVVGMIDPDRAKDDLKWARNAGVKYMTAMRGQ